MSKALEEQDINEALKFIAEIIASQIQRGLYINLVQKRDARRKTKKSDPD